MTLKGKISLSSSMTIDQFDNGYWYTVELRKFAKAIGIGFSSRLRKDQLEYHIKLFLKTGKIESPEKLTFTNKGVTDIELGLSLELPVKFYTNNKMTYDFLEKEAHKIVPDLKRKPGARYRLNRWRENQLAKGSMITYRDLMQEYIRLNLTEDSFTKIPQARYINFLSDFLKLEKRATRKQAINAWEELKLLDIPKDYLSWKNYQSAEK